MMVLYSPLTNSFAIQVSESEMMHDPAVWSRVYRLCREKIANPQIKEEPKQLEEKIPCLEGTLW